MICMSFGPMIITITNEKEKEKEKSCHFKIMIVIL